MHKLNLKRVKCYEKIIQTLNKSCFIILNKITIHLKENLNSTQNAIKPEEKQQILC